MSTQQPQIQTNIAQNHRNGIIECAFQTASFKQAIELHMTAHGLEHTAPSQPLFIAFAQPLSAMNDVSIGVAFSTIA